MKTLCTLALCAALSGGVRAAEPAPGAPALLVGERYTLDMPVVAVDQATRQVTLRTPEGALITVTAGPELRNLAQLAPGDVARVEYAQALRVTLKKGGGVRERVESMARASAQPGAKPAAASEREVHFVADVTALDPASGAVQLRTAQGRRLDVRLQDPSVLQGYGVGDQVEGTFIQVLAIGAGTPAQ